MKQIKLPIILMLSILAFPMCQKDGPSANEPSANGPAIFTSFSPESAFSGDTITLSGVNFTSDASVKFGNVTAKVVNVNNKAIRVIAPATTEMLVPVYITINNVVLKSGKDFRYKALPAEFVGFSPKNAYIGDTITLTVKNPGFDPHVNFGTTEATLTASADGSTLKVAVPDKITEATTKITLSYGEVSLTHADDFKLNAPEITSITPSSGFPGQQVTIKGKGFRDTYALGQVIWGSKLIEGSVTTPGHNTLKFSVPNSTTGKYDIAVDVAGMKASVANAFEVMLPVITSVTPDTVSEASSMVIRGHHFADPNGGFTSVILSDFATGLNSRAVYITSLSDSVIRVTLTAQLQEKCRVTVNVVSGYVNYDKPVIFLKD